MKFHAGQEVWRFAPRMSRGSDANTGWNKATVTKVGRRWVHLNGEELAHHDRYDGDTGIIDGQGYTRNGRIASFVDREAEIQRANALAVLSMYGLKYDRWNAKHTVTNEQLFDMVACLVTQ